MQGKLSNKTILIAAAGQGIGRASAELFTREGASVYATDINADALASLEGMHTRILDVTDQNAIDDLAQEINPVNVLFNCAGFVHNGTLLECSEQDWTFSFALNIDSMYHMIRAFLPGILALGAGSIINVSSSG